MRNTKTQGEQTVTTATAEGYAKFSWFMAVLNMTAEQIEDSPNAKVALAEIIGIINSDPDEPMGVGLRKQVERILGPQQWKQQGDVR